ncbi:indole-3-glycerol phosphate synthase TrpC [Candidatus Haliotispira prima]|uniref:indole-3-glycerol-phosphate synthase n=1 Tax=Candidatus Haliotispira prima TaxID=3034016 RepID=A0ABY8MIS4_9SPIO|nr:indole-3-glycerol phosphate synthase TrpC [Candidatus Haliotispira prima]
MAQAPEILSSNILDRIVADKRRDLPLLKQGYPLEGRVRQRRTLSQEALLDLLEQQRIIAEIKRASPSMGQIDMGVDHVQQAVDYQAGGAGMISVLTDERYFSGSFTFLEEIGRKVDCPLLCKDFIIDEWQIDAAQIAGADAILLIVTCLVPAETEESQRLQELYDYALSKGLLPLVELYSPHERYAAYGLKPSLLGVNSRNLQSMKIDLKQGAGTLALLRRELSMPQARAIRARQGLQDLPLFVGESGIQEPEDALVWAEGGADCLLIGTSLMLAGKNPTAGLSSAEALHRRISEFRQVFEEQHT